MDLGKLHGPKVESMLLQSETHHLEESPILIPLLYIFSIFTITILLGAHKFIIQS